MNKRWGRVTILICVQPGEWEEEAGMEGLGETASVHIEAVKGEVYGQE